MKKVRLLLMQFVTMHGFEIHPVFQCIMIDDINRYSENKEIHSPFGIWILYFRREDTC